MTRYDRLSALFARFTLSATIQPTGNGNLIVLGASSASPESLIFFPRGHRPRDLSDDGILLEIHIDLGGDGNPLLTALPERMTLSLVGRALMGRALTDQAMMARAREGQDEIELLVRLLVAEARAERCGFGSVLSRLAEVLIIRILRNEIERGAAEPGLLAGLADRRISRCIVAMHEQPDRDWRNDELAAIAGLSLSRFAEVFRSMLNQTPQAYLRRWRMTLARQDIARGERIKAISKRYGYGSSEAFAKAFHRHFGSNPLAMRQDPRDASA
jgi:AraC-like DNA-binding protein